MVADPIMESILKERDYDDEVSAAISLLKETDLKELTEPLKDWVIHEGIILYQG